MFCSLRSDARQHNPACRRVEKRINDHQHMASQAAACADSNRATPGITFTASRF
jgi:hypothetical protein